jgi:orotidine-5'-phosphate decarboxylase
MKNKAEIIVALDVDSLKKAGHFVNRLYPSAKIFKVGLQLFTAAGPQAIKLIHKKGASVFLDLKLFDIPNTVSNAVRQAARLKVKMLTLHIRGGEEMLKAAVCAAREESDKLKVRRPLLVGVTVLTSQEAKPGDVLKLASLGLKCGLDGVVCSAREAGILRKEIKKKFIIVTPGIRMESSDIHDQKRVATPREAVKAGSDFLVMGRQILEAKDPRGAIKKIQENCYGTGN